MSTTKEIELQEQMPKHGYPEHPIAATLPMMEGTAFDEFHADVGLHGVREKIVLYPMPDNPDKLGVLDGRNRQASAIKHGFPPPFRLFDPKKDGASPTAFVASQNLHGRRHLDKGQRATIAVELLPFFEAEARENQRAAGGAETTSEAGSANGATDASGGEAKQAKQKGHGKGKSTKRAADAVGVSSSSVAEAKKLSEKNPKAFKEVRAGKKKLHAAVTEEKYNEALERIEKICGKQQATGIRQGAILRRKKDVILYAKQTDEKMLAIRQFVDQGWPVQRALDFKAEDIVPTHRIIDLANRTAVAGGTFKQDVHIENSGIVLRISAQIIKGEAVKHRKAKAATKKKAVKKKH